MDIVRSTTSRSQDFVAYAQTDMPTYGSVYPLRWAMCVFLALSSFVLGTYSCKLRNQSYILNLEERVNQSVVRAYCWRNGSKGEDSS